MQLKEAQSDCVPHDGGQVRTASLGIFVLALKERMQVALQCCDRQTPVVAALPVWQASLIARVLTLTLAVVLGQLPEYVGRDHVEACQLLTLAASGLRVFDCLLRRLTELPCSFHFVKQPVSQ